MGGRGQPPTHSRSPGGPQGRACVSTGRIWFKSWLFQKRKTVHSA